MSTATARATAVPADSKQAEAVMRLFPLVARPRPACPSLGRRIDEVADMTLAARGAPDTAEALTAATRALTRAALIASDCGDPELARELCRKHIGVYAGLPRALSTVEATRMLGPAINLARLRSPGSPDGVVKALGLILRATRDQVPLMVDGARLPLGNVHGTTAERRTMVNLIRSHLLVAATTGLAGAGRWADAAKVARVYGGIGDRLLEGRQVLILDRIASGDLPTASHLIAESTPQEPWERAVMACLTALCATPKLQHDALMAMLGQHRTSKYGAADEDGDAHFRARHGLTVATIAVSSADLAVRREGEAIAADVVAQAVESVDGYAARDVLRHRVTSRIATYQQHTALARTVERSGLAGAPLTGKTRQRLVDATDHALRVIRHAL